MSYKKIDLNTWDRRCYYELFMNPKNGMRCRVGMTANVDITNLIYTIKKKGLRCYPAFTYLVSRVINGHDCFKYAHFKGDLVLWDNLHVRYPMFNEKSKTVTSIWLEYNENFKMFYAKALQDIEKYSGIQSVYAKGNFPPNFYDITSIPWVSFTDFEIDVYGVDGSWLWPSVVIGKFFHQGDKVIMPVALKVHHATCDGYHMGLFYNELQHLAENFEQLM